MSWPRIIRMTALLMFSSSTIVLYAQTPADEIAPLPIELSPERADLLRSLSPEQASMPNLASAQVIGRQRHRRYFGGPLHHPLTPSDIALRESVRSLGTDPRWR